MFLKSFKICTLDEISLSLSPCSLDESRLSIGRVKFSWILDTSGEINFGMDEPYIGSL